MSLKYSAAEEREQRAMWRTLTVCVLAPAAVIGSLGVGAACALYAFRAMEYALLVWGL